MQVDHQQDFGNNAIFLDTLKRNQKNVTAIENSNDCTKKKETATRDVCNIAAMHRGRENEAATYERITRIFERRKHAMMPSDSLALLVSGRLEQQQRY